MISSLWSRKCRHWCKRVTCACVRYLCWRHCAELDGCGYSLEGVHSCRITSSENCKKWCDQLSNGCLLYNPNKVIKRLWVKRFTVFSANRFFCRKFKNWGIVDFYIFIHRKCTVNYLYWIKSLLVTCWVSGWWLCTPGASQVCYCTLVRPSIFKTTPKRVWLFTKKWPLNKF